MSNNSDNNINPNANEGEGVNKEFVENTPEPITPESNPEEFEKIENVTDKKQSPHNPRLLAVADEFTNDKTNLLIRLFHSSVKPHLKNPEKHFILLVNKDLNNKEYECIWANDPTMEGKVYVSSEAIKEISNFKFGATTGETSKQDNTIPRLIKPYDVFATDYKTDIADGKQHFPTETLKFNNKDYWMSDTPVDQLESKTRLISWRFRKPQVIKYLCVNFHQPETIEQVFDIIYETDQYDERTGNPKAVLAFANVKSLKTDGIQIIQFDEAILTRGISFRYSSPVAAINYVGVIEQQLTDAQLNMFLDVNSNSDLDNKAFNNPAGNQ